MSEKSRGFLFRKRNVLGAALIAGIGLGIYLGKSGFDFGFGNQGEGGGKSGKAITSTEPARDGLAPPASSDSSDTQRDELPTSVPNDVRVVIDDRRYLLRWNGKEALIALPQLMDLIKKAPGDSDGVRVRIYQKMSARASAEEALKKELISAAIPDTAVLWVPPAEQGK